MDSGTVRAAYERGVTAGVAPVLVGTAGLWLRGYAVDPPDVDFLCTADPDQAAYGQPTVQVDGYEVQYIGACDGGQRAFYHPERADFISGVLVASTEDIIGLKRWRDREKDREFLRGWDAWANREPTRDRRLTVADRVFLGLEADEHEEPPC